MKRKVQENKLKMYFNKPYSQVDVSDIVDVEIANNLGISPKGIMDLILSTVEIKKGMDPDEGKSVILKIIEIRMADKIGA